MKYPLLTNFLRLQISNLNVSPSWFYNPPPRNSFLSPSYRPSPSRTLFPLHIPQGFSVSSNHLSSAQATGLFHFVRPSFLCPRYRAFPSRQTIFPLHKLQGFSISLDPLSFAQASSQQGFFVSLDPLSCAQATGLLRLVRPSLLCPSYRASPSRQTLFSSPKQQGLFVPLVGLRVCCFTSCSEHFADQEKSPLTVKGCII